MKMRQAQQVGHVACMGEMINAYDSSVKKHGRKMSLRTPRSKWENNVNELIYFFICGFLHDAANNTDFIVSNDISKN
jgi:hypothetical protein